MTGEERIAKFRAEWAKMRQRADEIHALHYGGERHAVLLASDIALIQSKLDRATDALEKALPYLKVLQGPTGERAYQNATATLAFIKGSDNA